jgi:hypothetical protein
VDHQTKLNYSESIINTLRYPLIILHQTSRVVNANHSFYSYLKLYLKIPADSLFMDWAVKKIGYSLATSTSENYLRT